MIRSIVLALALVGLVSGPALADRVVQTASETQYHSNWYPGNEPTTCLDGCRTEFDFASFDTSLGYLRKIIFEVEGAGFQQIRWNTDGLVNGYWEWKAGVVPGEYTFVALDAEEQWLNHISLDDWEAVQNLPRTYGQIRPGDPAGEDALQSSFRYATHISEYKDDPAAWRETQGLYSAPGGTVRFIGFTQIANNWWDESGDGIMFVRMDGRLDMNVRLTYVYNPNGIPEPSTWASMILGFGLSGSALRGRRAGRAKAL